MADIAERFDDQPAVTDVEAATPREVALDVLIEELLATRRMSFEVNKLVDESYAGRRLTASGTVRRARRFERDFDFRHGGGVKLEAVVGEVTGTRVGAGDVVVVAHLPAGTPLAVRGAPVTVTGTISKVEQLRRAIYLEDARIV